MEVQYTLPVDSEWTCQEIHCNAIGGNVHEENVVDGHSH